MKAQKCIFVDVRQRYLYPAGNNTCQVSISHLFYISFISLCMSGRFEDKFVWKCLIVYQSRNGLTYSVMALTS